MKNGHVIEINRPPTPDGARGTIRMEPPKQLVPKKYYCFECDSLGVLELPFTVHKFAVEQAQHQHRLIFPDCSGTRIVLDIPVLGGAA